MVEVAAGIALPFSRLQKEVPKPLGERYITNPKTLGDKIRNKRLELGLEQKDIAALFGVTECSIGNWELNKAEPCVSYYPQIITFLGYTKGLPRAIKRFRYEQGLSQKQFGKRVGADGTTVFDWENTKTEPKGKFLTRLRTCIEIQKDTSKDSKFY